MIHNGDVFLTKLERGFFGAFRVLKTQVRFDYSKYVFYLIAITSYIDTVKPDITDKRLTEVLREKRFSLELKPNINFYSGQIIEKHFKYLGNIPLTEEESKLPIKIGNGEDGGFPVCGAVQKDFGYEAVLEWRWEHERVAWLEERDELEKKHKAVLQQYNAEIRKMSVESVKEAYHYKDDKSDKFWRIEYAGAALAFNYGKTGTIGKCKIKEFDGAEECEKKAKRLISAKRESGYQPYPEFDTDKHFYFDDDEIGLHPLTSHPKFRVHFTDELYYDCVDDEAPFGSDEGSDTLYEIEKQLRKNPNFKFSDFPQFIIENLWKMKYIPAESLKVEHIKTLIEKDEMNLMQSDMITTSCAFAQIKITGKSDEILKQRALNAMQRTKIAASLLDWGIGSEITDKMIADLTAFS